MVVVTPVKREAPRHDHEGEEHPPMSVDEKGEKRKQLQKNELKRKNAHKTAKRNF
jgi:hypothetical protein